MVDELKPMLFFMCLCVFGEIFVNLQIEKERLSLMPKFKVFISSVQSEFANERQRVYDFIRLDDLMGQYFEPFIFEQIAAQDTNPRQLYLDEASSCQVCLLLMGQSYGNALPGELSPTEKEYQAAGDGNAYRVAFIKDMDDQPREEQDKPI